MEGPSQPLCCSSYLLIDREVGHMVWTMSWGCTSFVMGWLLLEILLTLRDLKAHARVVGTCDHN